MIISECFSSLRPLEIESGGLHQVTPWFEGRLDFAPVVSFEGDTHFPLKGGAVGYFLDRKAAVLVYAHGLHTISLFVFRAGGLHWPSKDGSAFTTEERGFNVVMWRPSSLGCALVSDVRSPQARITRGKAAVDTLRLRHRGLLTQLARVPDLLDSALPSTESFLHV